METRYRHELMRWKFTPLLVQRRRGGSQSFLRGSISSINVKPIWLRAGGDWLLTEPKIGIIKIWMWFRDHLPGVPTELVVLPNTCRSRTSLYP
jgi:hypothetical protein